MNQSEALQKAAELLEQALECFDHDFKYEQSEDLDNKIRQFLRDVKYVMPE